MGLSGCSRLFSRDYLVISPHLETNPQVEVDGELRVETYRGLKSAILSLIEDRKEEGLIQLINYSGDAETDVRNACMESTMDEPLGVYAVEYMSFESVRVLTYYEVRINITYRRTLEQIQSILRFGNTANYRARLKETFLNYDSGLTAEVLYYYPDQYNIATILEDVYYTHPLYAVVMPEYSVNVYPESGWRRIVEVSLSYGAPPDELRERSKTLGDRIEDLTADYADQPSVEAAKRIDNDLRQRINFLPDPDSAIDDSLPTQKESSSTAYGALIEGASSSEGYALAYKALCDRIGLPCQIIRGRYNSIDHFWTLVETEGGWYHVDTALNDYTGSRQFLLKTDDQLTLHKWNTSLYPKSSELPLEPENPVSAESSPIPEKAP